MRKRHLLMALFSVMLVLLLAACGTNNNESGGENEPNNNNNNNNENATSENEEVEEIELAQGVTDDEIVIGHLGPQTGPAAIYDLARKGILSHINYVNDNGGVNGRQIKFVAYDDEYQPAPAVQLSQKLVEEDEVFAMVGNVSATNISAYQDYLIEKGVPLVLMAVGAMDFFDPPVDTFMGSAIMNYSLESIVYLDYAVNELGAEKIAIAYQDDDFGQEGLQAVTDVLDQYPDVEFVEEVGFLASDVEFSAQAQKISASDPDAVLYFGSPAPAANLKKAMHKIGLTEPAFIASSVAANDKNLFGLAGAEVWEGTYSSAVFPSADLAEDDDDVKTFVEQFSSDFPDDPTSGFSQYGWGVGQVLVEALERTGDELTWDNFLETFYTFDEWDGSMYEGITLTPDNHFAVTSMFMTQAQEGEIVPVTDSIAVDPKTKEITYQ